MRFKLKYTKRNGQVYEIIINGENSQEAIENYKKEYNTKRLPANSRVEIYPANERQLNPDNLTSSQIQWYSFSGLMMGLIPLEKAKELVREQKYIVCTSQAIIPY